ncbi:hypothetical protein [Pseudolabrys sp. Root1462]|uniref:hypothetical protein n=1 Tax=Pseudolabrys sp. Root1462 TaxID=1736466 RepID=UPI0012E3A7F7|nr:hypothetical protein [Pseudolabrys sp. Root1462]
MPVTSIAGNSVISTAGNSVAEFIASMDKGDFHDLLSRTTPRARERAEQLADTDLKINGERAQRLADADHLSERMAEIRSAALREDADYRRNGVEKKALDPKTGKTIPVDIKAEAEAKIAPLKARRTKLLTMKVPASALAMAADDPAPRKVSYRDAVLPAVARKGKEEWPDLVMRMRAERHAAYTELERVQKARIPTAEALEFVESTILPRLRRKARLILSPAYQGGHIAFSGKFDPSHPNRRIEWPKINTGAEDRAGEPVLIPDAVAIAYWFDPARFKKRLLEDVAAFGDDSKAIPQADKPRLLNEIAERILWCERAEEEAILAAAKHGVVVDREPYRHPLLVLLGIEPGVPDQPAEVSDEFDGEDR